MAITEEMSVLAKRALGGMNTPKAYRGLPQDQQAMTMITLPNGKVVWLFGFAHERQTSTAVRRAMRDLAPVNVAHVIVKFGTRDVIETRAAFVDFDGPGLCRRPA